MTIRFYFLINLANQICMVIFLFEAFRGSAISWCGSAIEEIPIEHVEIVVIKG